MQLFARITKVDETLHEVHGRIAEEIPDSIGEIMDYAMSKPRFQEWSEDFEAATRDAGKRDRRRCLAGATDHKVTDADDRHRRTVGRGTHHAPRRSHAPDAGSRPQRQRRKTAVRPPPEGRRLARHAGSSRHATETTDGHFRYLVVHETCNVQTAWPWVLPGQLTNANDVVRSCAAVKPDSPEAGNLQCAAPHRVLTPL